MKTLFKKTILLFITFILIVAAGPSDLLICYGSDGHIEIEFSKAKECKIDSNNIKNVNNLKDEKIIKNTDSGCTDYYLTFSKYYSSFSKTKITASKKVSIPFQHAELKKTSSNSFQTYHSSFIDLTQVKTLFFSEILLL